MTWDEIYEEQFKTTRLVAPLPNELPPCPQCERTTHYRMSREIIIINNIPFTRSVKELYAAGEVTRTTRKLYCGACKFEIGDVKSFDGLEIVITVDKDCADESKARKALDDGTWHNYEEYL